MTGHRDCDLDGCEGQAAWQIRFELTEPSDATQVLGTFRLCVCEAHARPELTPSGVCAHTHGDRWPQDGPEPVRLEPQPQETSAGVE